MNNPHGNLGSGTWRYTYILRRFFCGKFSVNIAIIFCTNLIQTRSSVKFVHRKNITASSRYFTRRAVCRSFSDLRHLIPREASQGTSKTLFRSLHATPFFFGKSLPVSSASPLGSGSQNAYKASENHLESGRRTGTYQLSASSAHHCESWVELNTSGRPWVTIQDYGGLYS